MREMGLCLCLAAVATACWGATASPQGDDSSSLDPDLAKEVQQAEESDLDAALSRATSDAKTCAGMVQALMAGTRATVDAVLADLSPMLRKSDEPEPGSVEDEADQLLLSSQMLDAKTQDFLKKAAKAELGVVAAEREDLLQRRGSYRAQDRRRDLRIEEKYLHDADARLGKLKKGKKKAVELGPESRETLAACDSFLSEARNGQSTLTRLASKLKPPSKRLEQRMEEMQKDISDLDLERNLLEVSMRLARHDAESFDRTK